MWPTGEVPQAGMSAPRADTAAAHTTSGRQDLTGGSYESPAKVGQPVGQRVSHKSPLILSPPRDGIESRPVVLQLSSTRNHLGDL